MFALTASGKLQRREARDAALHYIDKVKLDGVRQQLSRTRCRAA